MRLQHAYLVTCTGVVTDPETGEPTELRCTYDPESRGGSSPDGRKVRGTSHWVSAEHSLEAEVRLYDRLFMEADPSRDGADFKEDLNPASVEVLSGCRLEESLGHAQPGDRFQFLRQGYFCMDPRLHTRQPRSSTAPSPSATPGPGPRAGAASPSPLTDPPHISPFFSG